MSEIAGLLRQAMEGHETTLSVAEELDGNGRRLVVERRQLQPEPKPAPVKTESQRRAHTFYARAGFTDYLLRYGGDDTVILADPSQGKVQAVIDESSKDGKEILTLEPQAHPRWVPWHNCLGIKMGLLDLLSLARNNRRAIVEPDGRALIYQLSQVQCSTSIVLHMGQASRSREAVNGITIKTKIQGQDDQAHVPLPDSITIETPVHVDEPAQKIELDLVLGAERDGTGVWCQLASADIQEAEIQAFDDLVEQLRQDLGSEGGEGRVIGHGTVRETGWCYR